MGLVIIEVNRLLKTKEFCDWYNHFLDQKELGLILLPLGFKATYVPDDVEVKMEDKLNTAIDVSALAERISDLTKKERNE